MLRNLTLSAVSLLLVVLVAEAVLRVFYAVPATWREPQVRHLESPLLGWVLPPGDRSYTLDVPVEVNAYGLRDDAFPRAKPMGELRVLALGDSFTFATGVEFEDLWVQRLERKLEAEAGAAQVINAGIEGYNTRQELIFLLARGFDFEPDLVLVAFYWNDLLGNAEPLPDLDATPVRADDARLRPGPSHTLPTWMRDRLRKSLVLYLSVVRGKQLGALLRPPDGPYHRAQRAFLSGDHEELEPLWRATELRLRQLAEAGRERGIPVALIAFPMENTIRRDYPAVVYAERLARISSAAGMPFVDLEAPFRDSLGAGRNPFLPYDLHPNALGMEIAAEATLAALRDAGLLAPTRPASGSPQP